MQNLNDYGNWQAKRILQNAFQDVQPVIFAKPNSKQTIWHNDGAMFQALYPYSSNNIFPLLMCKMKAVIFPTHPFQHFDIPRI